jgi:SAM-dependent methyltransferase
MTGSAMPPALDADKAQTVEQWNNDPCGSDGIAPEPGTPEFFAEVDRVRYTDYAPWWRATVGVERFAGRDVLEVGYGLGTDLMQFALAGSNVHGIDLTPRHHELATRRFALAGMPADLRLGDAEDLPWPDASFDVVYSFGVIHHTPGTERCVAEMRRVLRPGGVAIVAVYHRWSVAFAAFLARELAAGRLFREPWRRTLSRIETRGNSEACPLVKLYSRRQVRILFGEFTRLRVRTRHFGPPVPHALEGAASRIAERAGWYLVVEAIRP